ncbi:extracellular catalytic domain type 1 short-chain-length polyhydroxyalkanoate depolymerase [Amycolatopsis sp. H20-H5]|uniref:extracellular catalytic domain type 1 short-chain-length polyhydroxyalkanoate depolymerase n=1 Tax=Amycolatopsis sp. H20-H5 TaxID=3046309 RepID=UPI002DB5DCCD|nr:PHB depolymerase family esterase [Amycolatopsis sp. H20-H5]MEC3981124.1 PHB depolymerase family esterase [Amycolatopsis sp. H20-H5]
MRKLLIGLVVSALLAFAAPALASTIRPVTGFGSNPGALQMFEYVPDGLPPGRPVVVALHGCTQDASGYGQGSGWVELAERWRFTLVLPQQVSGNNLSKCFNWFQSGDTTRGSGEAESIAQMTRRAIADTGADAKRVYVSGLSAGGGMTSVMLAAYPELFGGGGIVAGLPFGCASSTIEAFGCMNPGKNLTPKQWGDKVRAASAFTGTRPTVSIWQGTADYTVAPANLRELAEQWTDVGAATAAGTDTVGGFPHAVYRDSAGRVAVETYSITGMGHGQPVAPGGGDGRCGHAAPYLLDVGVCAAWQLGRSWALAG